MPERNRFSKTLGVALIILATGVALYFILTYLFPQLVGKFVGLFITLFLAVTGLFLRRPKKP